MKKLLFILVLVPVLSAAFVSGAGAAQEKWKLLNEDELGNRLYIDEASIKRGPQEHVVSVTMRFELKKSETTMLFVDEVDCAKALVRRLSLKMLKPVCTGDGETFSTEFEGRWDTLSEGIERKLFEAVCK